VLLYYITDRHGFAGTEVDQRRELLRRIAEAAHAEVDYVQLREKDLDPADLELLAREALHVVRSYSNHTKFLVNTQTDIALAIGADGIHIPAGRSSICTAREQWPREAGQEPIIGVSAHSSSDLQQAQLHCASFAVLSPIFEKVGVRVKGIGLEALRQACAGSGLPVLALGGVNPTNAKSCLDAGARGVAGIRLFQQGDAGETVKRLRQL